MGKIFLRGVVPILPTIFTASGGIDETGMQRVIEYIISAGARGIAFPGLASECDTLSRSERLRLTRMIGDWIGSRVLFIVGASATSADDAVAYAAAGADAGATAAMILTPKAYADNPERMRDFYQAVHLGSGMDIMLQNAPAPLGLGLTVETVAELVKAACGIRYVKEEATPSGQRITQLTQLTNHSLAAVFGGAGARYAIDELLRGARGIMPACEIVELHVAMFEQLERGDEQGARNLFERTLPLLNMQAIFRWRLTKAVLQRRGLIESTFVRARGPDLDVYDVRELDALLLRLDDLLALEAAV